LHFGYKEDQVEAVWRSVGSSVADQVEVAIGFERVYW